MDVEKQFKKWKFIYTVHGKTISEFSPDLNILLRRYSIKKIYDLLKYSNPSTKQSITDFLNTVTNIKKA